MKELQVIFGRFEVGELSSQIYISSVRASVGHTHSKPPSTGNIWTRATLVTRFRDYYPAKMHKISF